VRASVRQPAGFTLVEVLVTLSVIVVLATLLFALTRSVRNSALKARELSNIRNITQVVIIHQGEKNVLPGPVNRGVMMPSRIPDGSRNLWLSTVLIDEGYLPDDDELWRTSVTTKASTPSITYVLNSTINSTPSYFFGSIQSNAKPKSTMALRANVKASLGGPQDLDLSDLWLITTADFENYGKSPLISQPVEDGVASIWGGRFYSFFDGRVEFIRRTKTSTYPSSYSGGHQ
jgi:prepilin-type N-terminal cleavage/methylation domain-containing protein